MIEVKEERILITPEDIPPSSSLFEVIGTINPGAIRLPSGEIVLYVRVIERVVKYKDEKYFYAPRFVGENKYKLLLDKFHKKKIVMFSPLDFSFGDGTKRITFTSHLRRVILDQSGLKVKHIDSKPSFFGLSWDGELGVEDPRISKINNLYVMTYVSLSRDANISTSYAISNDCKRWYRRGIIFRHQNKDVVIFPEMMNNQYVGFQRPEGTFQFSPPSIWVSYSKDLEFWGDPHPFHLTGKNLWDSGRVGAGPPPIKTSKGWLFIYHGVIEPKISKQKNLKIKKRIKYEVGAALLDLNDPKKIIAKCEKPILVPRGKYERGTFESKDVVFPTGAVLDLNGRDVLIYSGGGDIVTTVKKISLDSIFELMKQNKKVF
ncbi:MAG: hypothetical protein AABX73_03955 [Nanoarchaeota archaeon]